MANQAFADFYGASHTVQVGEANTEFGGPAVMRMAFANPNWTLDWWVGGPGLGNSNADFSHKELASINLNDAPDLHHIESVGFDFDAGWSTAQANVARDADWLETVAEVAFIVGVGIVTSGAMAGFGFGGAGASLGSAAIAGAAVGGTTSIASGLIHDNLSFKNVLRGTLSGALTAGLLNAAAAVLGPLNAVGNVALSTVVQGTVQAGLGGSFKDGALAGFASGLGQQIVASMSDGIKAAVNAGTMTPVEAAAAQTMARMLGSAIRVAASPGDPGQAFANAFLSDVMGQIDTTKPGPPVTPTDATSPDLADANAAQDIDAAPTLLSADPRALFRNAERAADPAAYLSVPGRTHLATPGQSITSILGTNDPQAIGNFMRANGLSNDTLLLGRTYFVPDSPTAYGNAAGLGQAALNASNARLAQARELEAQRERDKLTPPQLAFIPGVGAGAGAGGFSNLPLEPLPDALTQTQRIIQFAQVRNADLTIGAGPEAASQWSRRAEELLTVALQYKSLNKPTDGRPFMSDSIYNGLVADALQARAMAGAGVDRSALEQTARLLIENGEAAQAGAAAAGAAASRLGRSPITSQGTAHSATVEQLRADLSNRTGLQADTSRDADYIARTDPRVAPSNKFDWNHVLAGEVKASGKEGSGYHTEGAANGAARIKPEGTVTQHSNGTYEAPVQIWSDSANQWVDKVAKSTFFPADWSRARIEFEVTQAFKVSSPAPAQPGTVGTSPSGIQIRFFWDPKNQRTTFYPLKG